MPARMYIPASELKGFRQYRRLTQEEASRKIGCSKVYLSKIERGAVPLTLEMKEAIADVYDITFESYQECQEFVKENGVRLRISKRPVPKE